MLIGQKLANDAVLQKIVLVLAELVHQRLGRGGSRQAVQRLRLHLAHFQCVLEPLDLALLFAHRSGGEQRPRKISGGRRLPVLVVLRLLGLLLLQLHHKVRHGEARVRGVAAEAHVGPDAERWEGRLRLLRRSGG